MNEFENKFEDGINGNSSEDKDYKTRIVRFVKQCYSKTVEYVYMLIGTYIRTVKGDQRDDTESDMLDTENMNNKNADSHIKMLNVTEFLIIFAGCIPAILDMTFHQGVLISLLSTCLYTLFAISAVLMSWPEISKIYNELKEEKASSLVSMNNMLLVAEILTVFVSMITFGNAYWKKQSDEMMEIRKLSSIILMICLSRLPRKLMQLKDCDYPIRMIAWPIACVIVLFISSAIAMLSNRFAPVYAMLCFIMPTMVLFNNAFQDTDIQSDANTTNEVNTYFKHNRRSIINAVAAMLAIITIYGLYKINSDVFAITTKKYINHDYDNH
ncbi:hypothetical protein HK407_09g13950 [Ordospora pajunii]|uniref:uncharacterized protein n=1 Tax=Ordospora pajunii TaxID=3039483 RepID=UPI00295281CF|nr:uncharacterized protein HK407_09g13950 [Ordospora pajunii]KAH9410981.1 hypothetical protein HK407_09g13950 [Ordospora pajunii]